ncbi:MAG: hypothetical protein HGA49_01080 [Eubacteriaceae bacterium]|nr:hypothetical protein [Eubacteriaceae bacterium]
MKLDILEIINEVKKFGVMYQLCADTRINVDFIAHIQKNQNVFEDDVLYVGKTSDIYFRQITGKHVNAILVNDNNINVEDILQYRCNLIILTIRKDITEIYTTLKMLLSTKSDFSEKSNQVLRLALAGKDLQYITDSFSDIIANPVFIVDVSSNILACSSNFEAFPTEKSILEIVSEFLQNNEDPVFITNEGFGCRQLICGIHLDGNNLGFISILEKERNITSLDQNLLELAAKVVAAEIAKNFCFSNVRSEFERFLDDILEERYFSSSLLERCAHFDVFSRKCCILTVAPKDAGANNLVHFYRNMLEKILPGSNSAVCGNRVVVIFNPTSDKAFSDAQLHGITELLKQNGLICGLSDPFRDCSKLPLHLEQSEKALEFGRNEGADQFVCHYSEYYLHHLLEAVDDLNLLASICHPSFEELKTYDEENKTNYINTLEVYIRCYNNAPQAAKALGIHRNTLDYRIKKIRDLLNLDLNERNNSLRLYITFKIQNML